MIYAYPFESIWFTFRDKVAPAKQTFGSLQVVIRFCEWQAAGSRRRWLTIYKAGAMTIVPMYDKWLSFRNDYDFLFGSRAVSIGR